RSARPSPCRRRGRRTCRAPCASSSATTSRCASAPCRSSSAASSCAPIRIASPGTSTRTSRTWRRGSSRRWKRAPTRMQRPDSTEHAPERERPGESLRASARRALDTVEQALAASGRAQLGASEVGRVVSVSPGVARVRGLPGVQADELVSFPGGLHGLAYNLDPEEVGVVLLGPSRDLAAGSLAYRTGRILDVPVGDEIVGRVIDALGEPLDEHGPIRTRERRPIERPAPPILHRAPVTRPLQTGLKVIDSLLPIGRGQRELILGDRQTGKTAIALDTILNQ